MKRLFLLLLVFLPCLAIAQSSALLDGAGLVNAHSKTNYVKNPNSKVNISNVSSTLGTSIGRFPSTNALYAGTNFQIVDTGAWNVIWDVRALDPGLKNRLCEVQILAKSDTAGGVATLEVLQNSIAVFSQSLTLTLNPTMYGGTFPCGDLTYASTVKLSGASNPGTVDVGKVYLGEPVSVSSGAIGTIPQPYIPTDTNGFGTIASPQLQWERKGSTLRVYGAFTTGTTAASLARLGLPNNVVIDDVNGSGLTKICGKWWRNNGVATTVKTGTVIAVQGNSFVYFGIDDYTAGLAPGVAQNGNTIATSSQIVWVDFTVPISGWQATDIVTPEASLVEYAFNTSTSTTASDTTSFGYGPAGAQIQAITAQLSRRVRFQRAILPTDRIDVEVSTDRQTWLPVPTLLGGYNIESARNDGTNNIGLSPSNVSGSSTDVDVFFGRYLTGISVPWSNVSSYYWRVVKYPSAGTQSFYIQSPLRSAADGSGGAIKSSTNADLMTWTDAGAFNLGAAIDTPFTTFHTTRKSIFSDGMEGTDLRGGWRIGANTYHSSGNQPTRYQNQTGGAIGFFPRTSDTTETVAFYANQAADGTTTGADTVGYYNGLGMWNIGPDNYTNDTKHNILGQVRTFGSAETAVTGSPTNILSFNGKPAGLYIVTAVREDGNVGTNGMWLVGNNGAGTIVIYHTFTASGLTASSSGDAFRLNTGGTTDNIYANALYMVGGS